MDHHCPWLNNCVGFQNRKYFMMLLMYTWLLVLGFIVGAVPHFVALLQVVRRTELTVASAQQVEAYSASFDLFKEGLFLVCFVFACSFMYIMTTFYYFHLGLVLSNTTTLEHLEYEKERDPERKPNLGKVGWPEQYDVGRYYNWLQVYGSNVLLWFFPLTLHSGNPIGDGIVFAVRDTQLANQAH